MLLCGPLRVDRGLHLALPYAAGGCVMTTEGKKSSVSKKWHERISRFSDSFIAWRYTQPSSQAPSVWLHLLMAVPDEVNKYYEGKKRRGACNSSLIYFTELIKHLALKLVNRMRTKVTEVRFWLGNQFST